MNGQMQIVGKKKNIIDDDGPVSKKVSRNQKKNLNKTINQQRMKQELIYKNIDQRTLPSKKQIKQQEGQFGLTQKQIKKIDDIKSILSHHKRQTILKALQKHNFDKNEAMNELFDIPQDQLLQSKKVQSEQTIDEKSKKKQKKQKQKKQSKIQLGNEILNQIYDNQQQIDPNQFEQLFAEITTIIKQEQRNQGMDLFQINEFIDDCYLIKNVILQNQAEIYMDEENQLYIQTEKFLQDLIKSRVALQEKRKEEFPTLGAVNKNNKNGNNSNKGYIQQIQEGYKQQKMKQGYFSISTVPQMNQIKNSQHQYSLFSINNDPKSYKDILQLSKEYNDMGIDNLKFIYLRLHDINLCKTFLDKYYPGKKKEIKVEEKKKQVNYSSPKKIVQNSRFKRLQDSNYKNYSLNDIRNELDHLFKLRNMFRVTRGKITNAAHRKQLQRLACRQDPKINKLIEVARFKILQQMSQSHPQYIDLHGYREQEIDSLLDEIQDMIRHEFKKGNSKLQTIKSGQTVYCIVKAMTGKGLHSKYNRSVLKPAILDWCKRSNCRGLELQDSINLYIEVN